MSVQAISRAKVGQFIHSLGGRMFSVEFDKKNGERRELVGRTGVHKHANGGWNPAQRIDLPYLTVWEIGTPNKPIPGGGQYRMVNLNTVQRIRANGTTYIVR